MWLDATINHGTGPSPSDGPRPLFVDLLLTDLVMPGMIGRQIAERIRTDRPALRVLYASGHADRAIIPDGGLEAGARFLAKPFSADTVVRTVREVLDAPYPHGAPAETRATRDGKRPYSKEGEHSS